MRISEFETYRAAYCGLCRQLKKSFGVFARFTLSYDFTLAALVGLALMDDEPQIKNKRCIINPVRKTAYYGSCSVMDYVASSAMLLIYYKLCDDRQDEKGLRKLSSSSLSAVYKPAYKKSKCHYPELDRIFSDMIGQQLEIENSPFTSIDACCEPTAKALGKVFEGLSEDLSESRILYSLGYFLGRTIYITDALDDLKKDIEKSRFNPYASAYSLNSLKDLENEEAYSRIMDLERQSAYSNIAQTITAYDLIDFKRFAPIIENIIFLGVKESIDNVTGSVLLPE